MNKVTNTENNPRPDWLFGINPNAIEAQEAQGQQELVNSSQLPLKCNCPYNVAAAEQYEKMGIKIIGPSNGDDLFLDVELPNGWKKEQTDHSMWNRLIDDKGRIRATFFYKAAFYDRDAFINFNHRYTQSQEYAADRPAGKFDKYYIVKDNGTGEVLFKTETTSEYRDDSLEAKCTEFLDANYPNHKDLNAYW